MLYYSRWQANSRDIRVILKPYILILNYLLPLLLSEFIQIQKYLKSIFAHFVYSAGWPALLISWYNEVNESYKPLSTGTYLHHTRWSTDLPYPLPMDETMPAPTRDPCTLTIPLSVTSPFDAVHQTLPWAEINNSYIHVLALDNLIYIKYVKWT